MYGIPNELHLSKHVILWDHSDELVLGAEHVMVEVKDDKLGEELAEKGHSF